MSDSKQFCTFLLDGLFFGIEVENVQEVIRYQSMTQVPLASSVISGLINLRGQLVTAIDLRERLGLPERPTDRPPMNVVIPTDDGAVSFLVDEIGDVQQLDQETFECPPETMGEAARSLIRGVYKLKDRLMLVLDTKAAVEVSGGELLATAV